MSWKMAYLEARVLSADPVELIAISYEYATLRVQEARSALANGEIAERSKAISKAIAILAELESSLNHKQGGEIASNLGRLYKYMRERLSQANVKKADEPLAEVESLLVTLGEAWRAIGPGSRNTVDVPADANANEWNRFPFIDGATGHNAQVWSA